MAQTSLPKFNMDKSETGCCPKFDPAGWDEQEFELMERPFVRATTVGFLHIPLNMGSVFKKAFAKIEEAGATPTDEYFMLSATNRFSYENLCSSVSSVVSTQRCNTRQQ